MRGMRRSREPVMKQRWLVYGLVIALVAVTADLFSADHKTYAATVVGAIR